MTCLPKFPTTLIALTGLAGSGKDTVADLLVEQRGFSKLAFADALRREIAAAFVIDTPHLTHRETKEHPISALALDRCLDVEFVLHVSKCYPEQFSFANLDQAMAAPRSARQILQWWGTEYRRTQDPDYWTKQLLREIKSRMLCGNTRFVIPDCRFQNEADLVRSLTGSIWQISRPELVKPPCAHVSETYGNQFLPDVLLSNARDIASLHQLVLAMHDGIAVTEAA